MSAAADREREQLREIAETEPEDRLAIAAFLLGHDRTRDAAWVCSCGHAGELGEGFTHHQADELLALWRRRAWRRNPLAPLEVPR